MGWQYLIIDRQRSLYPQERELDELGRAGWELVSVIQDRRANLIDDYRLYFKRATDEGEHRMKNELRDPIG